MCACSHSTLPLGSSRSSEPQLPWMTACYTFAEHWCVRKIHEANCPSLFNQSLNLLEHSKIVCTHTTALFGESITGPISLLFCAKEHSASSKDDVDCERAKHPTQRLWSRRSASVEGSSKGGRKCPRSLRSPRYRLIIQILYMWLYDYTIRYTIQTYPKCSVGRLVLSTAWFLCP